MDTPTYENPSIRLTGAPLRIVRGYEVMKGDGLHFLGAHDGRLVEIKAPNVRMVLTADVLPELIEALQAVASPATAAPGAHDAEIRDLGYTPIPGWS